MRLIRRKDYLLPRTLLVNRWRSALVEALTIVARTDLRLAQLLAEVPAHAWARRWTVDLQPVGSGQTALRYLARFVQKTALDHARILRFDPQGVTIGWRERAKRPGDHKGLARATTLTPDEFLRRYLQHVLPAGFQRIRHGGFYSPAAVERYSRIAALLGHRPQSPEESWQARCEDCGGVLEVEEIRVGRVIIIPAAARLRRIARIQAKRELAGTPTFERAP